MDRVSQLSRLGLFEARVPRYTSYPTAAQFTTGVAAEDHRRWIAAIPEGARISLYVHVPFCRRLCWFCACRTQGTANASPVAAYLQSLLSELRMLGTVLPAGVTLSRLHWGGGTPTIMSPDQMTQLAGAIDDILPLATNGEFSVEIDPNEIDAPRLDALASAGMNRASIGVQDFDPDVQSAIGRQQSFDATRDAVVAIRDGGVHSLNADILFGLPYQTGARLTESVQKLLSLSPDRVALYGYAHVPWMARRQSMIPTEALPEPAERLRLFDVARKLFVWDGYEQIGIDHFARADDGLATAHAQGRLRRNFQGYTDDDTEVLIGVGASAISRFPQGYSQNDASTSRYQAAVRAGEFAAARGHAFTRDDTLRARAIEMLMCDFAIDRVQLRAAFDGDGAAVDALCNDLKRAFPDVLRAVGTRLCVREAYWPMVRLIAQRLDAYAQEDGKHSSAI